MLKNILLLLTALTALPAHAASLPSYGGQGCAYEGAVGADNLPEGQGVWTCANGNRYEGAFKNGKFNGKGRFTVTQRGDIFLEPFGVYSAYFKGMTVEGGFQNNRASGRHKIFENGQQLFDVRFDKGIMKDVKLTAKPKK
ncbi:Uncharacterized protein conserved in bacteria [Kingella potus]|uniref:Uncharacterized protein conserved in bacteria n=1 Tax=Kingella potus TaxID=265175 RepID=A0A377R4U7_9NEIS|nr:hypothetical protein [Kingella potus]UOP00002.1 hypothetical protein LVJ84_08230 [Kingella potus]STR03289.1 Uncharacterized protein conserved in bacteria [Kingella potus]